MKLLNEILGTKYPIIQGGMANIATGEFAAACSSAGALGLIGSGGMANVYKAVMRGQNGPVPAGTVVAVKVLRREYMHDRILCADLKRIQAISLLNHPNIVKVYDVSVKRPSAVYCYGICGRHDPAGVPQRAGRQAFQPGDRALHLPDPQGAGARPRQRCGAPGHQAPEHHAAGQRPAPHDGLWHRARQEQPPHARQQRAREPPTTSVPSRPVVRTSAPPRISTRWAS